MPIYDYKCNVTGQVVEKIAGVDDEKLTCQCGGKLERQFTIHYTAISDMKPYLDEHIGDQPIWIKSRKHRQQVMKETGVYEAYGRGWV